MYELFMGWGDVDYSVEIVGISGFLVWPFLPLLTAQCLNTGRIQQSVLTMQAEVIYYWYLYVYGSDYGFVSTQNLIIPYFVTFNGIVFRNFIAIKLF